jgi:hypothetical protein
VSRAEERNEATGEMMSALDSLRERGSARCPWCGWLARGKSAELSAAFTPNTGIVFAARFVGCWILLTHAVGDGAHLGGLLFGAVAREPS